MIPAFGHWPEVRFARPESGTKVPANNVKKDDNGQGLFDFSSIAA
jgi:hypothetical protein